MKPEIRFPEFSGEWVKKEFNNIFKTISTKQYQIKNSEIYTKGLYPVVDQGKNKIAGYSDNSNKLLKNKGIIVFGDHTTILKYIDFDFIVGADGVKLLKNKYDIHNLKFLYYSLKFNNIKPEGYKRHFSILKQLKFLIPPTLAEQEKIAEFLSSIDEKIEIIAKKIEKLKNYKKGLLQKMLNVTEKGEPELRFKEFSGKWVEKRLGEISICEDNKRIPLNEQERNKRKGIYPYWGSTKIMDYIDSYIFNGEYVLLSEDGGFFYDYKDKPIAFYVNSKFWANNHIHVLKIINNNAKFVYYNLVHKNILPYIIGGTRTKLNQKDMKLIKIFLPPTLAEQKKITKFLSSIDKKIKLEEKKLTKIKEYKKALLQKMLI